jgi:chemosensory pili system protein ChpA (sensor histidine kinase/response regulator)
LSTNVNSLPLQAIKPSLDAALGAVSASTEQFFAAPEAGNDGLASAVAELRRINGVLRMFGLDGLAVFCGELERLLLDIMEGGVPGQTAQRDMVRRALTAVARYLTHLLNGGDNAALRLFARYQELRQARGLDASLESDLFFPNLNVELPAEITQAEAAADATDLVRAARSKYQHALLKWLRQDKPLLALETMRAAVREVLGSVAHDHRQFWWVAEGLLDCLLLEGLPPELNPKRMLGRLDLQMKSLIEGSSPEVRAVLSEMLYMVARSHEVTDTVAAIKRAFSLEKYLPEAALDEAQENRDAQLLGEMRAVFKQAETNWERCVLGDAAACGDFAGQTSRLSDLSSQLTQNALHFLCEQVWSATVSAEPEQLQKVALDMAMVLLLLHGGIEHYANLDAGFHDQTRALIDRIRAGLRGDAPSSDADLDAVVEHQSLVEEKSAIQPLASEMINNLQLVEQALNSFFEDTTKYAELEQVDHLLGQVRGGLHMLSLSRAAQVLDALKASVAEILQDKSELKGKQPDALAFALSALQRVAQGLLDGLRHDDQVSDAALAEIAALNAPPVAEVQVVEPPPAVVPEPVAPAVEPTPARKPAPAAPRPAAPPRSAESAELLEIFLEEAREVLANIVTHLETSFLHSESREPLTTIRRGFHTLKGSGRMVGLKDIGEVAWAVERVMNKWLQDEKPATPGLLSFIAQAESAFRHWVEELAQHGDVAVAADELLAAAARIESGESPEAVLQPAQAAEPEPVVEEPVASEIVIGAVTMSPTMFAIATAEAVQHINSLRNHLSALRETDPSVVHFDFMRAAHTLAGINRTLGFGMVAELASALELWLKQRIDTPLALSEAQLELLGRAVDALDGMTQTMCRKQEPEARPELVKALQTEQSLPVGTLAVAEEPEAASAALAESAVPEVELVAQEDAPVSPEEAREVAAALAPVEVSGAESERVAEFRPADEVVQDIRDDVDDQLLPIFLEESNDLYPQIGSGLRAWQESPDDESLAHTLRRTLHTLKGGARMAGAMRAGELTHRLEDAVIHFQPGDLQQAGFWENLENHFDYLGVLLEQLRSGEAAPVADASGKAAALPQQLEIGAERAILSNVLRVRSDVVDRLVNEAGEIGVTRSHIETEMRAFKNGLLELTDSVNRLRSQLREIEIQAESQMQARQSLAQDTAEKFDPLEFDRFTRLQELTRFMNESVHDVQTVQQNLLKNLDETAGALSAQTHLSRELQQGLMSIRMVPFGSISERLYRIVRQTGKELGKKANLELRGIELELDRSMLEKMTAPFEHLLRNALVHGLESPELRAARGKPPIGDVRLSLRHENNEILFEFSDDGAGLDLDKLRARGRELGLLSGDEAASDDQVIQLIFTSGLTTADVVTEVAGRGVGMDVVRSEISALGGLVSVSTEVGKGTSFTIHLPLTLAVMQTIMVRSGEATYAIPSTMVEQVQQYRQVDLDKVYQARRVEWQGRSYPLQYLPRLLGDDEHVPEVRPYSPVLLLRSGDLRIALHVDMLAGNHEVVVKNIGPQLARMRGIAGATVLGNGQVALILNPPQLAQRIVPVRKIAKAAVVEPQRTQPLVMVVDDSLTVRKITTRLLARAGYQVVTAKDGVDALEQLASVMPHVMLLDIEMPRMDGFELTKQLRRDAATQNLPIIMITSRTADKHREHAAQLGVNEYLGKPYQEDELLRLVAQYSSVAVRS